MAVRFQFCPLFQETFGNHPQVLGRLNAFMDAKARDPLAAFGSSDKSFSGEGLLTKSVPKLRHAHLTHDISLLYTIGGRDPTIIRLYGVFTHDESGTGTPSNIKRQRKLGDRLARQTFDIA